MKFELSHDLQTAILIMPTIQTFFFFCNSEYMYSLFLAILIQNFSFHFQTRMFNSVLL